MAKVTDENTVKWLGDAKPPAVIFEQNGQPYEKWLQSIDAAGYEPISMCEHHELVLLCKRKA